MLGISKSGGVTLDLERGILRSVSGFFLSGAMLAGGSVYGDDIDGGDSLSKASALIRCSSLFLWRQNDAGIGSCSANVIVATLF